MHFVALLWGGAGVLGALTSIDSTLLVSGRSIVALCAVLCAYKLSSKKQFVFLSRKKLAALLLTGILLGIHWIFFFKCIQEGSVALALITYASGPAIIAIAEVLLGWSRPSLKIFIGALLSWLGIFCIHPITTLEQLLNSAFMYGCISAIAIVLMALLGKRLLRTEITALTLTLGQLSGALLVSIPFAASHIHEPITSKDIVVMLALGLFCSAIGQSVFNRCLGVVRVSTASVIATMEAPYGVILAWLFLADPLTPEVLLGTVFVTLSSILVSVRPAD